MFYVDLLGCIIFLSAGSDYEFVAVLHLNYPVHLKWYSILILNIT